MCKEAQYFRPGTRTVPATETAEVEATGGRVSAPTLQAPSAAVLAHVAVRHTAVV